MDKDANETLLQHANAAIRAGEVLANAAAQIVRVRVMSNGAFIEEHLQNEQRAVHGIAWIESTIEALRSLCAWGVKLEQQGTFGKPEAFVIKIAFGEYLAQLISGIPMGQNEVVRPTDLDIIEQAQQLAKNASVDYFLRNGNTAQNRRQLIDCISQGNSLCDHIGDETIDAVRLEYNRFTEDRIIPSAHQWHLNNDLIPDDIIADLAALGTFGVCIPESYEGLGLGKLVMCVITEELSRGWIGAGSIGTRSEIAGDLILSGGTDQQKTYWLPKMSSPKVIHHFLLEFLARAVSCRGPDVGGRSCTA